MAGCAWGWAESRSELFVGAGLPRELLPFKQKLAG